ncbi:FaeA/PapI family transcriptional regulator [Xylanibacillus composti]|nr:FaeA/PapI family transcriptional regulator [Xylanibacillus composti]
MSEFEREWNRWMERHIQVRKGERKQRLLNELGHGEMKFLREIWFPVRRSLDRLHPEYEVKDHQGKPRFLDFAYVSEHVKVGFDVQGYGPHGRDVSRWRFADERKRTAFLLGMGWHLCPFAYDDLEGELDQCRFLLQLVMGRFLGTPSPLDKGVWREKEVLRYFMNHPDPARAKDIADAFSVSAQTARRILLQLRNKQWIEPANASGDKRRIHAYVIHPAAVKFVL